MNRKTWDEDNKLDGEIIRCNVCGLEEAYNLLTDNRHEHTCNECGWAILQTDESVKDYSDHSYDYPIYVELRHKKCKN